MEKVKFAVMSVFVLCLVIGGCANPSGMTTDGNDWTQVDTSGNTAMWTGRSNAGIVVFDGKLWIIGGYNCTDVWSSEDGKNWTEVSSDAGWSKRLNFGTLVYNNKLWVMGGLDTSYNALNDVWSSENGKDWIDETSAANWPVRQNPACAVYDGKMWILGGYNRPNSRRLNDVWYSENGKDWTEVTVTSGDMWGIRSCHSSVVFDNKLWVLGGTSGSSNYKDVWYTTDGAEWTQAASAAWDFGINKFGCVAKDGRMYVLGGEITNGTTQDVNDVWYSSNGKEWTKESEEADWSARSALSTTVFNNHIWVLGGDSSGTRDNEVWYR